MEIPQILYKYREAKARDIDMLKSNKVYFASPSELNDPFDCLTLEGVFDGLTDEGSKRLLLSRVPPEFVTEDKIQQYKKMANEHPQLIALFKNERQKFEESIKALGVLSLSKTNDSIQMWSHYADSHRGFCIGFKNSIGMYNNHSCLKRVVYSNERCNDFSSLFLLLENAQSYTEKMNSLYEQFLLKKAEEWSYEQEWRIIGTNGLCNYSIEHIDRIILGVHMKDDCKEDIQIFLKGTNIAVYQAVKKNKSFGIDIVSLT